MEEFRNLKIFKKFFWDYKIDKLDERIFLQRIVDYWPLIVEDLEKREISPENFKKILFLIEKNYKKLNFKYSVTKNVINGVLTKLKEV